MNWKTFSIGDIAEVVTKGTTPTTYGMPFTDDGVNFIKAEALNGDVSLDRSGFTFISEDTHEKLKRSQLEPNDVLITIAGANVGKCGIVREEDLPANTNQAVGIIRVKPKFANPKFVYYHFKNPSVFSICQNFGGQAAQPNINLSILKNVQIKLPSLDFQNRIIGYISSYEDLIRNNHRRIQLLEESARLLYKEWFVHLRFPGHEHVKIVDGVPEGWFKSEVSKLCFDVKNSVNPEAIEADTPYIGLEHMPRRSITLSNWGAADKVTSNKYAFAAGDIIFGKIRPYFHKIGFALCKGITSSDSVVIRPMLDKYYFYCLMYLSSDYFIALASKTVKEGSKMPRADWNYLSTTTVLIPSDFFLTLFNEQISPIQEQLKILSLQCRSLIKARDLLLPRLMNGELTL